MLKDMTFENLQNMVQKDAKTRFSLIQEPDPKTGSPEPIWWIRANQGHSMKVDTVVFVTDRIDLTWFQSVKLDLQPINSVADIPTGVAVHGTNASAWEIISESI